MKYEEYVEYWKNAAISNKDIGHVDGTKERFKQMDIEEIWASTKINMEGKCVILENPEITPRDLLSDNVRKMIGGGVLFIEECKRGDHAEKEAIKAQLEVITCDFLSKVRNDEKKYKQNPSHPNKIKGLDLNTVKINAVGPLFGNWYGWRLSLEFNQTFHLNLNLDESKWNSDTKFSI